jgi:predicted XRE-type DNA-binding protein
MPAKPRTKKYTTAPVKEILHDGSPQFELLVQRLLSELTIEHDLANLRRERGMSQAQVAEIAGLKQPHIAKLESGSFKNFEIRTLIRVAAALGAAVEVNIVPNPGIARLVRPSAAAERPSARAANQR